MTARTHLTDAPTPTRPPAALADPVLTPPLKYPGGKQPLASRIVSLMPEHTHYVEPFAGGLAVLLARNGRGVSEVVNDLDGRLVNFWRVLRDPAAFADFRRLADATPFCQTDWLDAADRAADPVLDAWRFFVRVRQSLAGRADAFAPLSRARTRRGMNEQASAWLAAVDGLPAVHQRLRRVVILNRPAVEVIRAQDGPATLFYLDPPYAPATRHATNVYRCEMSEAQHVELLETLQRLHGKVMLSGYRCRLYDDALGTWRRVDIEQANHAATGPAKRRMIESLWMNFDEGGER